MGAIGAPQHPAWSAHSPPRGLIADIDAELVRLEPPLENESDDIGE
ncbi:MAG: hypothetical protein ACR2JY_15995 [Chloroflexota bacterium]